MSKTTIVSGGITDGTIATADIADDAVTAAKAGFSPGKIGQIVSTHTNATSFSTSASTMTDITGLSVAITPSATSSKILVMATVSASGAATSRFFLGLKRGSTVIAAGDASGSRLAGAIAGNETQGSNTIHSTSMSFLDSPSSSSEQTYKVTGCGEGSTTFYINRGANDSDASTVARGSSTITVIEVLA